MNVACHRCGGRLQDAPAGEPCLACRLQLALADDAPDDATPPSPDGTPPQAIGRYRLLQVIGRGSSAVVYRAWDPDLRRHVALKMLHAHFLLDDAGAASVRFRREAATVAQLDHPHIAPLYDHGTSDGCPWLVQKWFAGGDMAGALKAAVDPVQAARWLRDLADAVVAAHRLGIIHRDIKPSNVFLDDELRVYLGDFGIARDTTAASHTLTEAGRAVGSPGYMAPEQASGSTRDIGPATDIHGLGALLYHALTGVPPFAGASPEAVLRQVLDQDPLPVRRLNPSVPKDLEAICLKCLEKSPRRRYPHAASLRDDLQRFLRGEPTLARPVTDLARAWRWCRRRPIVAGLSAALVVSLAAGLGGTSATRLRLHSSEQRRRSSRDDLAFQMTERWANERQTRNVLDAMAAILRESPGDIAAARRAWAAFEEGRFPIPRVILAATNGVGAGYDEDGTRLAMLDRDQRLHVLEAETGRPLGQLAVRAAIGIAAVGLSPKGDHAWVLRDDQTMEAWSLPTWSAVDAQVASGWLSKPEPLPPSMAGLGAIGHEFSPDGRHVALAFKVPGKEEYFAELREMPSGNRVLSLRNGGHLVDGADPFPRRARQPRFLNWSPTGLDVRDIDSGQAHLDPVAVGELIEAGCWHPDGTRLVALPLRGHGVVFDVPPPPRKTPPSFTTKGGIESMEVSPDGRFLALASTRDGTRILRAGDVSEVLPSRGPLATMRWSAWCRHGLVAVATNGSALLVRDPERPETAEAFKAHGPLAGFVGSADLRWAATISISGLVELWDMTGIPAARVASHQVTDLMEPLPDLGTTRFTGLRFHPKGTWLAMVLLSGRAEAWSVPGLRPIHLKGCGFPAYAMAFHPSENQVVAAEAGGQAWAWSLGDASVATAFWVTHVPLVGRMTFDAAGRHLLLGESPGRVVAHPWNGRQDEGDRKAASGATSALAAMPGEDAYVVANSDGTVELRSVPGHHVQVRWNLDHHGTPSCIALARDGSRAWVGTAAGEVFPLRFPPAREPVPTWLVEWIEAMGEHSLSLDPAGPRSMPHRVVELRHRMATLPGQGFWAEWGRSLGVPRP